MVYIIVTFLVSAVLLLIPSFLGGFIGYRVGVLINNRMKKDSKIIRFGGAVAGFIIGGVISWRYIFLFVISYLFF